MTDINDIMVMVTVTIWWELQWIRCNLILS
jgi:hypothetical protein